MRVCHSLPTSVLSAVPRGNPKCGWDWNCRGRGGWQAVLLRSPEALTPAIPSHTKLLILPQGRDLSSDTSPNLMDCTFQALSFKLIYRNCLLLPSLRKRIGSHINLSVLCQWHHHHPCLGADCCCWQRPFSGKGVSSVGCVPRVSSLLHKPAVVEMFSAGQISSSLITGNNEVFVILKGKEEKRLRIVWEDDCAVSQVQRQEDYNG